MSCAFEAELQTALLLHVGEGVVALHLAGILAGTSLDLVEVLVALGLVATVGGKLGLGSEEEHFGIAEEDDVLCNLVHHYTFLGARWHLGAEVACVAVDGLAVGYAEGDLHELVVGLHRLVEAPSVLTFHLDECVVEFLRGVEESVRLGRAVDGPRSLGGIKFGNVEHLGTPAHALYGIDVAEVVGIEHAVVLEHRLGAELAGLVELVVVVVGHQGVLARVDHGFEGGTCLGILVGAQEGALIDVSLAQQALSRLLRHVHHLVVHALLL